MALSPRRRKVTLDVTIQLERKNLAERDREYAQHLLSRIVEKS